MTSPRPKKNTKPRKAPTKKAPKQLSREALLLMHLKVERDFRTTLADARAEIARLREQLHQTQVSTVTHEYHHAEIKRVEKLVQDEKARADANFTLINTLESRLKEQTETSDRDELAMQVTALENRLATATRIIEETKASTPDMRDPKYAAEVISTFVNQMGMEHHRTLAGLLSGQHRTLVQNTMRMFVFFCEILENQHSDGFFDARNEASCKLADAICNKLPRELRFLPYV